MIATRLGSAYEESLMFRRASCIGPPGASSQWGPSAEGTTATTTYIVRMHLLLVRHGRTAANVDLLLDTAHPGSPLDAQGQAQAGALVDRLAGEPIEAIFSSDHTRARQTAAPLAAARGL